MWIPTLTEADGPLYKVLADAIERDIFTGTLQPGEKLPTHRDLADELGMNVSTVTRGYREAEQRGLVSGTVGRGTYVASDAKTTPSMVSMEPSAPGLIEMGLVTPMYYLDPDIEAGLKRLIKRRDPNLYLRYTDPRGLPEHREAGVEWARRYGLEARAEDIVITAGAQHALTCCMAALFRSGDRIATECLTYPGVKTLASMLGLRLVPVPIDDQGMTPEGLDAACRRDHIKGLYVMPGVHNPTTAAMSEARREEIARIARQYDLTIIEDDAYDLTDPGRIPPVAAKAPDRSVYVAGVSKALAAGLRVAFMVVPEGMRRKLAEAVLGTVWMAPPLSVELISMWIKDGTADKVVAAKRTEAGRRYAVACDALQGLDFSARSSGFYLWLQLSEPWKGYTFESRMREVGVSLFGAEKFIVGDTPAPAAVRISLTGPPTPESLRHGLGLVTEMLSGDVIGHTPLL